MGTWNVHTPASSSRRRRVPFFVRVRVIPCIEGFVLLSWGLLCGGGLASGATDDLLSAAPALGAAEPIVRALALCHAGSYGLVRRLLMESCPSALVPFASHHFPHTSQVSFWSELLVELCAYVKQIPEDHPHLGDLVEALKGAMEGASRRLEPLALLELLPDEGQAAFFLPYLLSCCRTHYQGS
ncbi:unnamed protein product [Lampetra planeri]